MNNFDLAKKQLLAASALLSLACFSAPVLADGLPGDYDAIPPVISLAGAGDKPNIMVILDNSNSMDEAADGRAVGSDNPNSKSEIARNAIKGIITTFGDSMRMGLMAYDQDTISLRELHDSQYDVSFDPKNYDASYTGNRDSQTKAKRVPNPTDASNFIHYNIALPFYSSSNSGNAFCYSSTADFDNGSETVNAGPWDKYECFDTKVGDSDNGTDGMSGSSYTSRFSPTDSDIAQNILDFGTFLTWQHIGPTWFANSSPGGGELHVDIADIDLTDTSSGSQLTKLTEKLATSQFVTATDTPLRNAGLTPIQGTLIDAKGYFGTYTSGNVCTATDDYVILVTDGLPSTDKDGNKITDTAQAIADAAAAAAALLTDGIKTYVIGFALPAGVDVTLLDKIAIAGGTGSALDADNASSLNAALNSIFLNIINRSSSGTGAAVLANNSRGDGAFYQALYVPVKKDLLGNEVTWVGVLNGLFIDQFGKLREDTNGNKQIDDYATDKIVEYYYDALQGNTFARLTSYADPNDPTTATTVSDVDLENLKYIWSARDRLGVLSNTAIQRNYSLSASTGRAVYTTVDGTNLINFVHNDVTTSPTIFSYMELPAAADAENTVRWIRGEEIPGFRSRKIDWNNDGTPEIWRLGDIIHSTPVVVSSPKDRYDLSHGDPTYAAFVDKYYNRRHVIYVGGNDGMLHAFNAGFWDDANKAYKTDNGFSLATGISTVTSHPLGSELWSYVPKAALPHLKWLTSTAYSHTYYVDGEPVTFDANVFTADTDHPNGWGTILVVPMRLGGGEFSVDTNNDGTTDEILRSSIAIFDITNPEKPPKLMAEISHEHMGFTTSKPALVKARIPSSNNGFATPAVNRWLLAFGSGPMDLDTATTPTGKTAKLFLYDLASLSFVSNFDPLDLGDDASYVGDIGVADWDSDFVDDALYFGVNKGLGSTESGRLARVRLGSSDTSNFTEADWLATAKSNALNKGTLINTQRTMLGAPLTVRDDNGKRWVYGGTGRLFVAADNSSDLQQYYYGIMEPVDASGIETLATVTSSTLEDVTDIRVFTNAEVDRNGSPFEIPSGSPINNFNQLESAISKSRQGWLHELTHNGTGQPSGRNINATARFRSLLFYTEYVPSNDSCKPEGNSELHAINYKTGTATPYNVIGTDPNVQKNGGDLVLSGMGLGKGLASSPTVITNNAGTQTNSAGTLAIQLGTGELKLINFGEGGARGGRESWQEIEMDGINL